MKHIITVIILIFSMNLTGAELSPVTDIKPLVSEKKQLQRLTFTGEWVSVQKTQSGATRKATIRRAPNGTYVIDFEFYSENDDLIYSRKEFGMWGVSGGIYFTIYQGWFENDEPVYSNPVDANNYDTYKLLKVSKNELTYQNLSSGNTFTYTKLKEETE
ncbi:hypothetical protein [Kangiella sp. M94]